MGKQTPQAPAAPDPVALANAQGTANKDTAITQARLNAVDQVGPFGTVKYTESGGQGQQTGGGYYGEDGAYVSPTYDASGTPKFTQTISLSPEQQALYNSQQGITQKAYDTAGQAIGNVQNTLSTPFSLSGLPALQTGAQGGSPQAGYNSVSPLFGIAPSGGIQSGLGNAGNIQGSVGQTQFNGNIADVGGAQRGVNSTGQQTDVGYSNPIQTSFAQGGQLAGNINPTGQQQSLGNTGQAQGTFGDAGALFGAVNPTGQQQSFAPSGNIQNGLDVSGIQQTPLSAQDFSQQGQRVQDALLSRFNQDIGRRQEDVESRLNAQGIQRGSAGFANAQDDLNRSRNDAFSQAVLAGSQEQDRLFNQQLAANQNQFGQRQAQGNFANQAQGQQYGQNLSTGQFANDAAQRQFEQQLASGGFQNAQQQQAYSQAQGRGDFANAAQGQNFGQALAGGQFGNDALNNLLQQQLAAGGFQNATAGQQYNQNLGAAQFGNQAQNQGYGQALSNAQFGNDARNNAFQQDLSAGQFGNQAQAQDFGQAQARLDAQNAAAGNTFQQGLQAGQFGNTAQAQQFAQNLSGGQFGNAAQSQLFGQNAAQQQAYNQAAQQQTGNNAGQAAFYNTAQQQAYNQALQNAGFNNQARQQAISEQQLQRSQPINEIATLLGLGGGIQVPTGAPNFGVGVGQTDVLGAYGMQQQAQQNAYNQQVAQNNALWGGLGNLGGALGGALIMSDARTKNIKRRVGQTPTGIPLYLYSYRHDPEREIVGVMAQDVCNVNPMAVYDVDGILHVNYAEVA